MISFAVTAKLICAFVFANCWFSLETAQGFLGKQCQQLWDNCIQMLHLGRYIVGYTVGNFVLRRRIIRRYLPPEKKNKKKLNMVIPFLIYCLTLSIENAIFFHAQSQATLLMTSGFRRDITEYTVAKFRRHSIRRRVTFLSALECIF